MSVTNPDVEGTTGGPVSGAQEGTVVAVDDPPAGEVVPDEGGAVHPLPVGSLPVANPDVESGDVELVPVPTPVVPIGKFDGDVGPTRNPKDVPKEDVEDPGGEVVRVSPGTGDLIDLLLATGADVNVTAEVVKQPFFSVAGTIILVDGERVQVMEYRDPAALEAEAAHISPDGSSIGTTMVSWVAPPHFFRTETTIVLYVGENPKVIEALTSVLGPQFAGR